MDSNMEELKDKEIQPEEITADTQNIDEIKPEPDVQNTEIESEAAEIAPEVTEIVPEAAEIVPEAAEIVPEVMEIVPEVMEIVPEAPEIAPIEKITSKDTEQKKKRHKRILQGAVVSNKADKTITVSIVRQVAHPLYKKYYKRSKKVMAHDEKNECNKGDTVKIRECRPLSARKRWEMFEIVQRAK
jgi:small subunit ribosomal protein S17